MWISSILQHLVKGAQVFCKFGPSCTNSAINTTSKSYVYWTVYHLDSWIKRDQLDVTSFFISLFNVQHVSDVNTSIFRILRLICWVISWVVLLWCDVCWCYVVVWLGWCGILMQAEAKQSKGSDIKLVSLYSSIKMMHGPINVRLIIPDC